MLFFPCISGCMVKNHQTDSSDQPSQPDWYPLLERTTQAIHTLGLLRSMRNTILDMISLNKSDSDLKRRRKGGQGTQTSKSPAL